MPPRSKNKYSKINIKLALNAISNGLSARQAALKYGIPRSTLHFRINNSERELRDRPGPPSVLTPQEESELVNWLLDCKRKWFPRRLRDLQISVKGFLTKNKRKNKFLNNTPGRGWYKRFINYHPELCDKKSEVEPSIQNWFNDIESFLNDNNLLDILSDPTRIYKGDETVFQLDEKTIKPFEAKYENLLGCDQKNISVMFSFSANGDTCQPMIIYPYARIPEDIIRSVPGEWCIGRSISGIMKAEVFYEYLGNCFHPYLIKNNIKLPVILFVDGSKTNITYQTTELCSKLNIILISLYPQILKLLKPDDIKAFRPIKSFWKTAVANWTKTNPNCSITKQNFASVLCYIIENMNPDVLKCSFNVCKIFPWDSSTSQTEETSVPDVDVKQENVDNEDTDENFINIENYENRTMSYGRFESIVGGGLIESFKTFGNLFGTGVNSEYLILYQLWKEFQAVNDADTVGVIKYKFPGVNTSEMISPTEFDIDVIETKYVPSHDLSEEDFIIETVSYSQ